MNRLRTQLQKSIVLIRTFLNYTSLGFDIHTYIRMYVHTYIHTVHTYIHTYIHTVPTYTACGRPCYAHNASSSPNMHRYRSIECAVPWYSVVLALAGPGHQGEPGSTLPGGTLRRKAFKVSFNTFNLPSPPCPSPSHLSSSSILVPYTYVCMYNPNPIPFPSGACPHWCVCCCSCPLLQRGGRACGGSGLPEYPQ